MCVVDSFLVVEEQEEHDHETNGTGIVMHGNNNNNNNNNICIIIINTRCAIFDWFRLCESLLRNKICHFQSNNSYHIIPHDMILHHFVFTFMPAFTFTFTFMFTLLYYVLREYRIQNHHQQN